MELTQVRLVLIIFFIKRDINNQKIVSSSKIYDVFPIAVINSFIRVDYSKKNKNHIR